MYLVGFFVKDHKVKVDIFFRITCAIKDVKVGKVGKSNVHIHLGLGQDNVGNVNIIKVARVLRILGQVKVGYIQIEVVNHVYLGRIQSYVGDIKVDINVV